MAKHGGKREGAGRAPRAKVAASETVKLRVTPDELAAWRRKAGEQSLSEWIRERCNR